MNGSYRLYNKVLQCGVWTVECVSSDEHVQYCQIELEGDNQYHLAIHFKGNKAYPDLIRWIFLLQDANGEIVNGRCYCNIIFSPKQKKLHCKYTPTESEK